MLGISTYWRGMVVITTTLVCGCASDPVSVPGWVKDARLVGGSPSSLVVPCVAPRMGSAVDKDARRRAGDDWDQAVIAPVSGLHHPEMVSRLYQKQPRAWTQLDGRLNEAGEAVVETLASSADHLLRPDSFQVQAIQTGIQTLEAAAARESTDFPDMLSADWTALRNGVLDGSQNFSSIDAWLEGFARGEAVGPSIAAWRAKRVAYWNAQTKVAAEVERRMADGLIAYAIALNRGRDDESEAGEPTIESGVSVFRDADAEPRVRAVMVSNDTHAALNELQPRFVQYRRLAGLHARYRALCGDGGWEKTTRAATRLRSGRKGDTVKELRLRLFVEGYLAKVNQDGAAPSDEALFDDDLEQAIIAYQRTHQLSATGRVDKRMMRSLNIGCEQRTAEIGVSLEKWRDSRVPNTDGPYVFVNIPGFRGEVWEGGERKSEFKVIVGKGNTERKRGERVYPNATPELVSAITTLVFNPYWNVPRRIRKDEFDDKIEADPNYLDANNYEWATSSKGMEWIRQKPGPKNALGQVKFLFPNAHSVYLHDTPAKSVFRLPFRAKSHGCVRVDGAIDLARLLLEREGRWNRRYARRNGLANRWVRLKQPVPIVLEYYLVNVDDDGFAHFHKDIYKRDSKAVAALASRTFSSPTGLPILDAR